MVLNVRDFTAFPVTREDARTIIASISVCPDQLDFANVISVSHCFADELLSTLSPASPQIVNASPYVNRILRAAAAAI
jgi:hypothetical protein